jgi:hypothetical protein
MLSYDDAWELSLLMRKKADEYERSAADLDRWDSEKSATEATKAWAKKCQQELRERAVTFRRFARQTLDAAKPQKAHDHA